MASHTGERRVTAADVARSLGLSRATVGFVLNATEGQTISTATRERVLAEADRLGYRPHIAARALASGRSRIILMVLPDWPIDFSMRQNIDEATHALDDAGYALITYTHREGSQARPLWETLQPDAVVGMMPIPAKQVQEIKAAGVRHVIPDPEASVVEPYPEDGPRLQVAHLVDLGHRRLAFAGSSDPRLVDLVALRSRVAAETAEAHGLQRPESERIDLGDTSVDEALGRWVAAGVTGIVAYNDDIAAALVGAAARAGIQVPTQISIVGHDDAPIASLIEPHITSVRINAEGLGRYTADLVLNAVEGTPVAESSPTAAVSVVLGRSTAPARGALTRNPVS